MKTCARQLAEFVTSLSYEDIPPHVVEKAKACIIDTVAASTYGAQLPWSKLVIEYVKRTSAPGHATILGTDAKVRAPMAALANGALAHSFELDAPVHPSVGVHPGPGCALPGLAVSQGRGRSGKDYITAFVAGFEAMHRIAATSPQSSEHKGFHAPGLFGTFGGAMTAGRLMDLDAARMTNAIAIAGSLCSGILEFSQSGGGMVKRLHPGRAAEGGVMAAGLARDGFTGPPTVIEGKFGFLNVFCSNADLDKLTAGLGKVWETVTVAHKRYAAHGTAHVPMTAALALKAEHKIAGEDVASVLVEGNEKIVSHHDIKEPAEIGMAQYSVPFCMAVAFYRDPLDPNVFSEASVNDAAIRALTRNVAVALLKDPPKGDSGKASRVTVKLKDGRTLVKEMASYPGLPDQPLTREQLKQKFDTLTAALPRDRMDALFAKLIALEGVENVREITFA